jgi:GrpB-like predicted nucleotidyltransferase (UPF0157 family)
MAEKPLRIALAGYDPRRPELFQHEAERIRAALGIQVLQLEHIGSTSVPGLAAKPTIDTLLAVEDSADESAYLPALVKAGYMLTVREPDWYEHRMLKRRDGDVNLHVFSAACPEIDKVLLFRDWLRTHPADRDLYARTKLALSLQKWETVDDYARAKTVVIEETLARARDPLYS